MRLHRLAVKQDLPISLEEAWAFFSDPWNLPEITPPWLRLRITSNAPHRIYPGLVITYSVSPFPFVRNQWVTEITHVVDRELFVDEQRFGPYRFWHHQHHFRAIPGGVRVIDIVHYALPFDPVSEPVHRFGVRPRLRGIFRYRREVLRSRFGSLPPADVRTEEFVLP
jgi:ligand-binding SRPBCC domain-containing protein